MCSAERDGGEEIGTEERECTQTSDGRNTQEGLGQSY